MTKEEITEQIVAIRKACPENVHDVCVRIGIGMGTAYNMGRNGYNYELKSMLKLVAAMNGQAFLDSKEMGKAKIVTARNAFRYLINLVDKRRTTMMMMAKAIGMPYGRLEKYLSSKVTLKIDEWLHICDVAGIEMSLVAPTPEKKKEEEEVTPIYNMTRADFMSMIVQAKVQSGISVLDLSMGLKMLQSLIYRFEKGIHNSNMKLVFSYLSVIGHYMRMSYKNKEYAVYQYDELQRLFSDLFEKENLSYRYIAKISKISSKTVICNFLNNKNVITIDVLLKICNVLGIKIEIVKNN